MWISFIGFLAAGKRAAAHRLAAATGRRAVDLDGHVARDAGRQAPAILARGGVAELRDRERRALLDLPADAPLVIAAGAGAVESAGSMSLLRERGLVIWLDAPWPALRARLRAAAAERDGVEAAAIEHLGWAELEALYLRRRPMYAHAAHLRLGSERREPEPLARIALARSLQWQSRVA